MPMQNLPFPVHGLHRGLAFYEQPPRTCPGAQNVRSDDNIFGRARGGSRPGLVRVFPTQMGSSGNRPVRMASGVRVIPDSNNRTYVATFSPIPSADYPPWPGWMTFTQSPALTGQPEGRLEADGEWIGNSTIAGWRGFARSTLFDDFDATQSYSIEVVARWNSVNSFYDMRINFNMDDSTPDSGGTGASYAELSLDINADQYTLKVYTAGSQVGSTETGPIGSDGSKNIIVSVDGTTVNVTIGTTTYGPYTVGSAAGTVWGFSSVGTSPTELAGLGLIRPEIIFRYVSTIESGASRNVLVFSAYDSALTDPGGGIWRQNAASDDVTRIDIDPYNLVPNVTLQAAERTGLLYIGDYIARHTGNARWHDTGGAVNNGYIFRDNDGTNLVAAGVEVWDCVVFEETSADKKVIAGTYLITAIQNGAATNDEVVLTQMGVPEIPFDSPVVDSLTPYRIERPPKVYNPVDDSFSHVQADVDTDDFYGLGTDFIKGPVPCGHQLVARHLDRIFLAAPQRDPQNWTCCREGDPGDWYTGSLDGGDTGRAMTSATTEAGVIGEPITCMIPFTDDYLVFGCTNSMWILRGNPASAGASLDNISDTIGVVSANSYARMPDGSLAFLSRDGIYHLPYGATTEPKRISREKLPRRLLNIDRENTDVFMSWDVNQEGMLVLLVPKDGNTTRQGWWYQMDEDAWWPETYVSDNTATALVDFESDVAAESAVYLGCRDGYVRNHSFGTVNDDGNDITSFVVMGPFLMGPDEWTEGLLRAMSIRMSDGSGSVTWETYTGQTAQEAAEAAASGTNPFASGTLGGGLNDKIRDRMRGKYWCLRLQSTSRWALELITADYKPAGMERVQDVVT